MNDSIFGNRSFLAIFMVSRHEVSASASAEIQKLAIFDFRGSNSGRVCPILTFFTFYKSEKVVPALAWPAKPALAGSGRLKLTLVSRVGCCFRFDLIKTEKPGDGSGSRTRSGLKIRNPDLVRLILLISGDQK